MGQSLIDMQDNFEILKVCRDGSLFCRSEPNPCCRYAQLKVDKPCGNLDCFYWNENVWSWDKPGLSRFVFFMLIQFVLQFALLLCIETGYLRRVQYSLFPKRKCLKQVRVVGDMSKDSDVIEEENKIAAMGSNSTDTLFKVNSLTKNYSDFAAVRGISFSLNHSECFGLLGNLMITKFFSTKIF